MADIITIDGPTSSGKNSVGFLLAQKLGYQYIDSGMIYRAGCYKLLKLGITIADKEQILEVYRNLNIRFDMNGDWKMFLDNENVTDSLHTQEISELTSQVSAIQEVRNVMKSIQQRLASEGKVVMSGRDIGSEIFPESRHKFFLTADVSVRARRRYEQLAKKDPAVKYDNVLADMIERDKRDATRKASPMRIPKGATVIDTSNLTVLQTVNEMLKVIKV